jgi:hypothetical protein
MTGISGNVISLAFHSAAILTNFIVSFFEQKIEREELEKSYQRNFGTVILKIDCL